jgi:hypothetical protein
MFILTLKGEVLNRGFVIIEHFGLPFFVCYTNCIYLDR